MQGKTFTAVSLFSGCGGLDLGFHGGFDFLGSHYAANPITTVLANDINKAATQTFVKNFPSVKVLNSDVRELVNDGHELPEFADVVIGGFPCQDFSLAGKRQGLNVHRGQLYLTMVEAVRKVRPRIFIAENVRGLLLWENGLALEVITSDFESLGYRVEYRLLNAADYGVPQQRKRIIIIGVRNDISESFVWPEQTHAESPKDFEVSLGIKPWVSVSEAIGDLQDEEKHKSLANSGFSKAKKLPKGQGNNAVKASKPAPTMRAEHHGNIEFHYELERRLSAREAARIQSFPDEFVFLNSTTDAYRQVGNAVAPVFAWHLAQSVVSLLSRAGA